MQQKEPEKNEKQNKGQECPIFSPLNHCFHIIHKKENIYFQLIK